MNALAVVDSIGVDTVRCKTCFGYGNVDSLERDPDRPGSFSTFTVQCDRCGGTGRVATTDATA